MFEVALMLCMVALGTGYLALAAWRWPSDHLEYQRKQQQMVDQHPKFRRL